MTTTRYRLYTENKNKDSLLRLFSTYLDGYTIYEAMGQWQGVKENSLIMEYIGSDKLATLKVIAERVKASNHQQAVLITTEEIQSDLI